MHPLTMKTLNNEHDEVSMNDVQSDIVVDGVINRTPAEITEFMMPMNENSMNVDVNVAMMPQPSKCGINSY
jgi:hypothetical protein